MPNAGPVIVTDESDAVGTAVAPAPPFEGATVGAEPGFVGTAVAAEPGFVGTAVAAELALVGTAVGVGTAFVAVGAWVAAGCVGDTPPDSAFFATVAGVGVAAPLKPVSNDLPSAGASDLEGGTGVAVGLGVPPPLHATSVDIRASADNTAIGRISVFTSCSSSTPHSRRRD